MSKQKQKQGLLDNLQDVSSDHEEVVRPDGAQNNNVAIVMERAAQEAVSQEPYEPLLDEDQPRPGAWQRLKNSKFAADTYHFLAGNIQQTSLAGRIVDQISDKVGGCGAIAGVGWGIFAIMGWGNFPEMSLVTETGAQVCKIGFLSMTPCSVPNLARFVCHRIPPLYRAMSRLVEGNPHLSDRARHLHQPEWVQAINENDKEALTTTIAQVQLKGPAPKLPDQVVFDALHRHENVRRVLYKGYTAPLDIALIKKDDTSSLILAMLGGMSFSPEMQEKLKWDDIGLKKLEWKRDTSTHILHKQNVVEALMMYCMSGFVADQRPDINVCSPLQLHNLHNAANVMGEYLMSHMVDAPDMPIKISSQSGRNEVGIILGLQCAHEAKSLAGTHHFMTLLEREAGSSFAKQSIGSDVGRHMATWLPMSDVWALRQVAKPSDQKHVPDKMALVEQVEEKEWVRLIEKSGVVGRLFMQMDKNALPVLQTLLNRGCSLPKEVKEVIGWEQLDITHNPGKINTDKHEHIPGDSLRDIVRKRDNASAFYTYCINNCRGQIEGNIHERFDALVLGYGKALDMEVLPANGREVVSEEDSRKICNVLAPALAQEVIRLNGKWAMMSRDGAKTVQTLLTKSDIKDAPSDPTKIILGELDEHSVLSLRQAVGHAPNQKREEKGAFTQRILDVEQAARVSLEAQRKI